MASLVEKLREKHLPEEAGSKPQPLREQRACFDPYKNHPALIDAFYGKTLVKQVEELTPSFLSALFAPRREDPEHNARVERLSELLGPLEHLKRRGSPDHFVGAVSASALLTTSVIMLYKIFNPELPLEQAPLIILMTSAYAGMTLPLTFRIDNSALTNAQYLDERMSFLDIDERYSMRTHDT